MKTRALLLALPLLALGCVDNRASLTVQGICFPSSSCTFTAKCDSYFLGTPSIDPTVAVDGRLTLFFDVSNQLPDNSNSDTFKTNTNGAHIDEAVVDYEGIALPRQTLAMQQWIPAASTAVLGLDVMASSTATAATLAAYAPTTTPRQMGAVVRLRGYWEDGTRFETGEFPIAVDVCSGCVPLQCAPKSTCPPNSEGQTPINCGT